jgi:RHS repeat-associated protein
MSAAFAQESSVEESTTESSPTESFEPSTTEELPPRQKALQELLEQSENNPEDSSIQTEEATAPEEPVNPTAEYKQLTLSPKQFTLDDQQVINQNFVNLLSGSAEIRLPLQTPNGIRGLTPQLTLEYSSQSVQQNSPFGFGWRMDLGEIKRLNKNGVEKMYEDPVYHISLGPLQGELIFIGTENSIEEYRLRREQSFAKILHFTNENRWEVQTTSGVIYRLGSEEQSRFQNDVGSRVFSWYLDQTRDLIGHSIDYEYQRIGQVLYPSKISYGAELGESHPFEIEFHAIERNDYRSDYSHGFFTEIDHVIDQITILVQDVERLRYDLTYLSNEIRSRSDLKNLQITGINGTETNVQTIQMSYYSKEDGHTGELYHRSAFLKKLQFPKGGTITYDYKPSTQFFNNQGELANLRPHYPLIVVSEVTQSDFTGRNDTTKYHYSDGHFFFESVHDRELAGFGRTTVTDALNQKTIYYFHQGGGFDGSELGENQDSWPLIGQMYRSETFDPQGKMVQRAINTWVPTNISQKRSFIAQTSSVSTIFNAGNQGKSTATSSVYDSTNGNLLESIEHGEVMGNNNGTFNDLGSDHRKTVIEYATNTNFNLSSFPSKQQAFNENDELVSESSTIYDDLSLNRVRYGNQTSSSMKFLEESRDITSLISYNDEGLPTEITDALGNTTIIDYEELSLAPQSITNALGHTTTMYYDLFFSQPVQVTDPNGLKTEISLDGLGRVTHQKMTDPNQGNQLVTMSSTEYLENSFPHQVVNHIYLDEQTTADYYQYFDGFGRIIQTKAEDDGASNQYIVTNTSYDALGRSNKITLPIFVTGTGFNLNQGSNIVTTTTYDTLNRPLTVKDANGTTSFSYDLWNTTVTDALGNSKTTESDAFGRLVKVVERLENAELITKYQYNSQDSLTRITDANGNIRNFEYDSLGRMKLQEDLHNPSDSDFGTRTYTHDDNGNVLSTTKADGKVIQFTYDALNRPLTQVGPTISYEYTYDQGNFGLGKLSSISGNDYTWSAEYDIRGRVTAESISLLSTINYQPSTKSYTYTRFNQPSTITTPDGLVQTYTYNQIGQIKEINSSAGGIITHISYSPLSQVEALSYGNGLRSTFVYDPNKMYRLIQKKTAPASVPVTFKTSKLHLASSYSPRIPTWNLKLGTWNFPRAQAQEIGIVPVDDSQPTVIDDTEDPIRDLLELQLQQRGPNRDGQRSERKQNLMRDISGEVLKPTITHSGPLTSKPKEKDFIYFQASYENTMSTPSPAVKYQVVVEQNGTMVWDSGKVTMAEPLPAGSTGAFVPYGLSQLNNGEATWKIAFELQDGSMTPWSDSTIFNNEEAPIAPVTDELQNINFTYDAVGNITQLNESSGTAATKTAVYEYDDLYRLTSSTITGTTVEEDYIQTQTYDPTGNILKKSDQGDYDYNQAGKTNPQAVTFIDDGQGNTKSFTYDVNGNLTREIQTHSDGSTLIKDLHWDELDRISEIEITNEAGVVTTISFTYDHSGRRLSKTITTQFGVKTTLYPFADFEVTDEEKTKVSISGNSMHLATIESAGGVIQSGISGASSEGDGASESPEGTRIIFSHTDHLGGGNILTDATGNQVQTLDYYPFGSIRVDEEYQNFDETKKYTGHEFDDESGLYYAQARYYDSEIGRFVSGDPLQWRLGELMGRFQSVPQALNYYSYAMNNPIILLDPDGEATTTATTNAGFSLGPFSISGGIGPTYSHFDGSIGLTFSFDVSFSTSGTEKLVPKGKVSLDVYNTNANNLDELNSGAEIGIKTEGCISGGCVGLITATQADALNKEKNILQGGGSIGLGTPGAGFEVFGGNSSTITIVEGLSWGPTKDSEHLQKNGIEVFVQESYGGELQTFNNTHDKLIDFSYDKDGNITGSTYRGKTVPSFKLD